MSRTLVKSVMAGVFIGLGCVVNLTVGGVMGAALFSLGLTAILVFGFNLFTGKASDFSQGQISLGKLGVILVGNLVGTFLLACAIGYSPLGVAIMPQAHAIISTRLANGFIWNFVLSVFCGILVITAIKMFKWSKGNLFMVMLPVMAFILCGFGHCIADSFYFWFMPSWYGLYSVIVSEIFGNFVGCCLMGMVLMI